MREDLELRGCRTRTIESVATGVLPIDTPIVFVTGYTSHYSKSEILDAGGEALIPKPVNFTLLSIVMASLFAGRECAHLLLRG